MEEDGNTHSVIFINSNAQEFETFPLPGLVYRTIGAMLSEEKNLAKLRSKKMHKPVDPMMR